MVSLEQIGILNFQSYSLKGKLFEREEDFVVQEIEEDGRVLGVERQKEERQPGDKKDYLAFTLVKRGMSTPEAVKILSRSLHVSFKRIAYNGNKDKRAITSQRISIFKLDAEKLKVENERAFCTDLEYNSVPCKIGKLYGNRFTVVVREFDRAGGDLERIKREVTEGLPNFYGPQRFGSSSLNIEVSRNIIKRDFKAAFYDLVLRERAESQLNRQKREELKSVFSDYVFGKDLDREKAEESLSKLPGFMYYEKESLGYLMQHKNDFAGAMRLMPKYTRLMILQAYQYYVFNRTLSTFEGESAPEDIPTIGYDFDLKDDAVGRAIEGILREDGIEDTGAFKIDSMPEASLKSFMHPSRFLPENMSFEENEGKAVIKFDLKKGSYATILLMKLFGVDSLYDGRIPDRA